jgi:uncharacterized peroxidase-related enzyme
VPFLSVLSEDANLGSVYTTSPQYYLPLVEFSEAVMRGPSPFSAGERELIAAYSSGLNACGFCSGAHRSAAIAFGVDEEVFAQLMEDVDGAAIDDKLKPVLKYVHKLTLTPARMTQGDADAVFAAGWDETALSHAVNVCALFNYFNRVVDGHGLVADASADKGRGEALASMGYADMHGPRLQKLIADGEGAAAGA